MKLVFALLFILSISAANATSRLPKPQGQLTNQLWYIDNIGLSEAWKIVDRAPRVKVAVIDMDFTLDHPEMVGMFDLKLSKDFSGKGFKVISDWGQDVQHGLMTSGLIGANGDDKTGVTGVSKKSHLIAINIAPVGGPMNMAEVFKYAVDSGAKVINCSIGIEKPGPIMLAQLREGVQYAADHDVVIVASAGNSAANNDKIEYYPANFSREFENVISVGASNRRDLAWKHSQYGLQTVDLFSPGEDIMIISKPGQYKLSEGTSEAAPITSGVVALMREINPQLSAAVIKRILRATAVRKPAFKDLCVSGGRLNALAAITAAIASRPKTIRRL